MSIVRNVIGGVDTHADVHVAAAIDSNGGDDIARDHLEAFIAGDDLSALNLR